MSHSRTIGSQSPSAARADSSSRDADDLGGRGAHTRLSLALARRRIQRKAERDARESSRVEIPTGAGEALSPRDQERFGAALGGVDLSAVRIHRGSSSSNPRARPGSAPRHRRFPESRGV
jgi:hypothetical protein